MNSTQKYCLTHAELCNVAVIFLQENGFKVSFDDRFKTNSSTGEQPDAIGFRRGVSCLVEAKVSRSDFLADKKKRFRKKPELGAGDWRFYISPPGIIKEEDLPEGWGLLYAYEVENSAAGDIDADANADADVGNGVCVCVCIRKVCGWPSGNGWWKDKPFKANKQIECDFMCNALGRLQRRGYLTEIYKGWEL